MSNRSGHVEIELDRGALPQPSQRVLDLDVDLRAVESAAAFVHLVSETDLVSSDLEGLRCLFPHGIIAHGLFRPRRDIGLEILEPEGPEHLYDETRGPG